MKSNTTNCLLDEVWAALDGVRPRDEEKSLTELGYVAAVSTDGLLMRALLRMPATLCDADLLAEIEAALRTIEEVRGIELKLKVPSSWTTTGAGAEACSVGLQNESTVLAEHVACVTRAVKQAPDNGWTVEGFHDAVPRTRIDSGARLDRVHVSIQARVYPEPASLEAA